MKQSKKARQSAPAPEQFKNQALKGLSGLRIPEAKPDPPKVEAPPAPRQEEALDEDSLFQRAMRGVIEIPERPKAPEPRRFNLDQVDEDAEAAYELVQLVEGKLPFDITYTDEYIEGRVSGVASSVVQRLKQGEFAVQGVLDLHGLTRAEARDQVERFIRDSRHSGKRCVLIVHGRGLNSKDQTPVLKEALRAWFERGRGAIGGSVLAFCTARPVDGGWGAMYVLLRKPGFRP